MSEQKRYEVRIPKAYHEVHCVSARSVEEAKQVVANGETIDGRIEPIHPEPEAPLNTNSWIVVEV